MFKRKISTRDVQSWLPLVTCKLHLAIRIEENRREEGLRVVFFLQESMFGCTFKTTCSRIHSLGISRSKHSLKVVCSCSDKALHAVSL